VRKKDEIVFAGKQREVLRWWTPQHPQRDRDGIICDGAVRSGKTLSMGMSFVAWAMAFHRERTFALCGKTIASLRRNVLTELLPAMRDRGFTCQEKVSQHLVEISLGGKKNRFYLFGGRDESSAALIQGITLTGVLLDEVVLMPRSFVEQAIARCSPEGAKLWFNCNPAYPGHWFYQEWIRKAEARNCLYLHFTMDDNPSLSEATKARYRRSYSGTFYARFIEGKWTAAQGLVYPMFSEAIHVCREIPAKMERWYVSCDYGTANPSSFGLWGRAEGRWIRVREYYWDARARGEQRTDEEHYRALEALAEGADVTAVVCDPSAASFLECIRRHGRYAVIPARNEVLTGIRLVAEALRERTIQFSPDCADCLREFQLYRWEENGGRDAPRKEDDHAMDDVRYFVSTALAEDGESYYFASVKRG
jgi:PBSX family phage terminase large subunit